MTTDDLIGQLVREGERAGWFRLILGRLGCMVFGHARAISWRTPDEIGYCCALCYRIIEIDRTEPVEHPNDWKHRVVADALWDSYGRELNRRSARERKPHDD